MERSPSESEGKRDEEKTASPRRVAKEAFDQISCSHNFPFQVLTSLRRVCFFRADMNVLLSAKAESPTGTRQRLRSFFYRLALCCINPPTVLRFAASRSLYDDVLIHAARGYSSVTGA
jgi:hypothetical protein